MHLCVNRIHLHIMCHEMLIFSISVYIMLINVNIVSRDAIFVNNIEYVTHILLFTH